MMLSNYHQNEPTELEGFRTQKNNLIKLYSSCSFKRETDIQPHYLYDITYCLLDTNVYIWSNITHCLWSTAYRCHG